MEYTRFGNAGIMVSRLCFGAMTFLQREGDEGGIKMVHEALDAGINFFDTADQYAEGRSEEVLGKALKKQRDHVVIATKLWVPMYPDDPNGRGCGRYHMMRAVEDSLRRLGTDHIDLYQLHHPDENAPVEETLSTLDTLVKQGKVRYIGVCNHFAWQMAHMLGVSALHNWEPIVSIQCRHSIFDRAVEIETAPFAQRFNIAGMTYSPLAGGVLSGKVRRDQKPDEKSRVGKQGVAGSVQLPQENVEDKVYDVLDDLAQIGDKYGLAINQLAIKWSLSKDWIAAPIMGGSKPEHYSSLYNIFDVKVDDADFARIDEISEIFKYMPFQNQGVAQGAGEQKNWL